MVRAHLAAGVWVFAIAGAADAAEPAEAKAKSRPAVTSSRPASTLSTTAASPSPASLRKLSTISLRLPPPVSRARPGATPNRVATTGATAVQPTFLPSVGAQVFRQQFDVSPRARVQLQVTTAPTIGFGRGRRCWRR